MQYSAKLAIGATFGRTEKWQRSPLAVKIEIPLTAKLLREFFIAYLTQ
jgi:hypothetical protein